ncbi:MAG: glycosyltransferase [Anaerolineae bacterium]|nr:glycosyltransferase [Anaerolineae bacterium]
MRELACSVVVPAYQAQAEIGRCLQALAHQTVPRSAYEVIVVDDGSTDGTAAVARANGADRVIVQPHAGPAAARNAGVAAAVGELVLFTDADCAPVAGWIAEMLAPFGDPGVVGVKGSYHTRQRQVVARLAQCEFEERYERLERWESIDFVDTHAAAFRRRALQAVGGFDPAFPRPNNEDVDLSYRMARAGMRLVFNRRAAVVHRHPARWWDYFRLKVGRGYWRMLVYRRHPGKALRDAYTPQVLKVQVLVLYGIAVLVGLAFAWRPAAWLAAGGGLIFFLTALPFTCYVLRRDRQVAAWAPLFVALRALAFAVGVAAGGVGMVFFRSARAARNLVS